MRKILFIDVDGTLVDYENHLPESAVRAIRAARAAGHRVYICTGRSKAEVYPPLWEIGLDGMIGGNGSYVEDHGKVVMHQLITPEQARTHPRKNLITRALGAEERIRADLYERELVSGDYLLLCSDGLVNTVTDQEMLFEVIHGDGPDTCLDRLLAIAKRQGAPDNVTAVLMQMQ